MTYRGHQVDQSISLKIHSAQRTASTRSWRVGLTALLVFSGGAMAQSAWAADLAPTGLTAQVPASAKVIYVNPTLGLDSPDAGLSEGAAYRTITYALQQAQGSTVIQLAPGSYTRDSGEVFPLVLKSGVILRGDETTKGQTVTIIGGGAYTSPTFASQNVTLRPQKDSEIRGVTVTNPNTRGTAVWVESTNPTIRDSTFSNSLRDGVFVTGTGTATVINNVFTRNNGNGISVARAAKGEIRGNLLQDTGFGIAIGDTASPVVAENQVTQNTDGIVVSNSAKPTLRKNVIEANRRDGVVAIAQAQPDLGTVNDPGNNIIRNNGRYDVYNATRGNTLVAVGNEIDPGRISGPVDFVAAQVGQPPGGVATVSFPDVTGHWAQAYIEALAGRNIITGFPDGTYRPSEPVTRAQFAAIVTKAFTPTAQRAATNFVDVGSTFWAYQAIQTAYRGGFLAGYPGRVFSPDQRIPRVQVLVALASGLGFSAGNTGALSVYQDATQIPAYATGPVAAATQRQLVVNYPTPSQLNPNREATRAEVAAFVYQALVNAGRAPAIPSAYLVSSP